MSALDFAHFKKIAQDKKCATLRHPDGHEIKIAVASLSPGLKKKLEALPLHQAEPEGSVEALDNKSPAQVNEDDPTSTPIANQESFAGENPNNESPAVAAQAAATQQPAQLESAPAPAQEPVTVPIDHAVQQPAPPTPEEEAAHKTKENLLVGQDMANRHITPQTYGDLFAKKDTLGKIGTLFGLLVSGAGAGLTHQPNAVMAMMDKQIQNDLDAQKTYEGNKQNWWKLGYEKNAQDIMNQLHGSQALLHATEAEKQQVFNKAKGVVDNQASTEVINTMRMAALHSIQLNIDAMPPGPARDSAQAQQNANMIAAQGAMHQGNLAAAQNKSQFMSSLQSSGSSNVSSVKTNPPPTKGPAEPGIHYDVVDQNKVDEGMRKGMLFGADAAAVPGAIPVDKHAAINKEIEDLGTNRNNWADANDAFDKLAKIKNAGQVPGAGALAPAGTALGTLIGGLVGKNPVMAAGAGALGHLGGALAGETVKSYFERQRQVQVDALVQRLRSGGMGDAAAEKQAEAILPKWSDGNEQLPEVHYQLQQHFKANEDNKTPNLKQFKLLTPQPVYKFTKPKAEPNGASGGF